HPCLLHLLPPPPTPPLFPYTTLFRSHSRQTAPKRVGAVERHLDVVPGEPDQRSRGPVAAIEDDHVVHRAHQPPPERQALRPAERSEEHTSELQSRVDLVCRLLLEKKK